MKANENNNNMLNEIELNNHELVQIYQKNTPNIRNICVLAHVDHGKTTLVDSLISYNNIISPKMAGNIRYMDSREDEQERCITMKASSISVIYRSEKLNSNYLLNIIDVPGHIDFSYEIFSSLKMVDGALILIDVIEGICSQTESVIRQTWDEKIKYVLVFNKIDKLFSIVEMSPEQAYEHLKNLLEKVNAMMSSLILRDVELNNVLNLDRKSSSISNISNNENEKEGKDKNDSDIIEEKEKDFYFSPNKGNVIFTSATDNWAFTIDTFVDIFAKKYGTKKEVMQKVLWGDYYLNKKTKKFCTEPPTENSNPVFVDFIMKNIYKVYQVVTIDQDLEKIQKMVKSLNLNVSEKDLNQNMLNKNPNIVLRSIMREWLPIPQTVYDVIIKELPNPIQGIQNKIDLLFPNRKYSHNDFVNNIKRRIKKGQINGKDIPTIAYISKMVSIPKKNIQGIKYEEINKNNIDEVKFMAFARLYIGEIKEGDEYFVIGPKHDPKNNIFDIKKYVFSNIYYFMGQFLNKIKEVPVGNIFSVSDLEKDVFKTSTISSNYNCPSIIPLNLNQSSNIKVSITAENIKEMPILLEGLEKLNRSDPAVNYYTQSNGEHILVTSGEVHLERCIKDLEDELAKVKFKISAPIVNFKEGLGNLNYTFKKKTLNKKKELLKMEMNLEKMKERKKMEEKIIEGGVNNIDYEVDEDLYQQQLLKTSTPYYLKRITPVKKQNKIEEHKIKDVISKNEKKTSNFIQKHNQNLEQKGFAEGETPNKLCSFGITALGMNQDLLKCVEDNQKLIDNVEQNEYIVDNELFLQIKKFKEEIIEKAGSTKLKKLLSNYIYSFGTKEGQANMLLIKRIPKKYSYFERIKLENENNNYDEDNDYKMEKTDNDMKINEEGKKETNESNKKVDKKEIKNENNEEIKKVEDKKEQKEEKKEETTMEENKKEEKEVKKIEEIKKDENIKEEIKDEKIKENENKEIYIDTSKKGESKEEKEKQKENNIKKIEQKEENKNEEKKEEKENKKDENKKESEKVKIDKKDEKNFLDEKTIQIMKEKNIPMKELLNSLKMGFDLAIKNGPLCEENMYGVIFVLEFIEFKEKVIEKKKKDESDEESEEEDKEEEDKAKDKNKINILEKKEEKVKEENINKEDSDKLEEKTASKSQTSEYGPFIGQITGSIKECCRKAYLCAEPRLYEAYYLCIFQINQDCVGKIYSVIGKRRGEIIKEIPSEESIKSTFEAIIPVAESFGFVEEIRKKSSGLANPMLQFYTWKMLNVDPFDIASEEDILNYGVNVDTKNIAKNYINKIRQRKGLLTNEKLVSNADKQRNLAKKK